MNGNTPAVKERILQKTSSDRREESLTRMTEIIRQLNQLKDETYRQFQSRLIPTVDPSAILGVRTPDLRRMAKELCQSPLGEAFLNELPHAYFEENQIHGFMISLIKDYDVCIEKLNLFLPYIDNWATCDQTSPVIFKKRKKELIKEIDRWLGYDHVYTVRFAIGMLMRYYLDDNFRMEYPEKVCAVTTDDYYIRMEQAWYFATALAKQWDAVIPFLENRRLNEWTHNKTIQKSVESFRITDSQKAYLKSLRIK